MVNKNDIAVVIYSFNEEKNIKSCIESARLLSSNILLIDTESTDKTRDFASEMNVEVHGFHNSLYVEPSREFGVRKAEAQWVFILDADERITQELADEIKQSIKILPYSFYRVPRKNMFAGKKWLKHGGWWPDHQIRLINKECFHTWPKEIHSTPIVEGKEGFLKYPLLHFFHGDLESMVRKTIIFENIEAELLAKAGKSAKTRTFMRKFAGELYRRLLRNSGFLDGTVGIIESIYQAFSKTITYLFLYEKKKSGSV